MHDLTPVLAEWVATTWDQGNDYFPPTSWQVSNIHAGTGAGNVIPGECVVDFNFRFCTESSVDSLKSRITEVLDRHGVQYELTWVLGGMQAERPPRGGDRVFHHHLVQRRGQGPHRLQEVDEAQAFGPQVIELGPPNASIHKINEHVAVADIDPLKDMYRRILERLQERHAAR